MIGYTTLHSQIEPLLLDRDGVLLCVLLQFIVMYLIGGLAKFTLSWLNSRVTLLPEWRQKQLAVAVPVILLKATIMVLIMDTLVAAPGFWERTPVAYATPSLTYRFQTLYFVAVSYIFELLQRPASIELVLHHLYVQGLPLYYWFWLRYYPPAHADLVMRFFELMVLLGPGATDITSDLTFLLYYLAPRSSKALMVLKSTSWLATVMRAVQWIVLGGYGISRYTIAATFLSHMEKAIFAASVILWVWTEVDEILKIRGMVGKFESTLNRKNR